MTRALKTNNHRDKRARHNYVNNESPSLPIPANGHQYTKSEALQVLLAKENRDAVKHIIELKYIPCGKSSLYRMLQHHNEGKPILNTEWSAGGRPRVIEETGLSSVVQEWSNEVGRTYGRKELMI